MLASGEDAARYINANIINVPCSSRAFIAAQGPLVSTRAEWWQMVETHS